MIVRSEISVAGFDGAALTAHLFHREGVAPRALAHDAVPLVCLPDHMRPAEIMTPFLEEMLSQDVGEGHAPPAALAVDYRGRGGSAPRGDPALYTPRAEAQDMIALLDALSWHRADLVASGRGGLVAMASFPTRPGLIRRLVLGDIGPELDGVGLARLKLAAARDDARGSWEDATRALRETGAKRYPALGDDDWHRFARLMFADEGGRPAPTIHPEVRDHFAAIDADRRYPDLWREFDAMRHIPTLLLLAEHGDMVGERTVERMRTGHADLSVHAVEGQGHAPLLHVGGLAEVIATFLVPTA